MNQTLFVDCCGYSTLNLVESTNGRMKFHGKYQEAETINKNKRRYPRDVLSSNVDKLEEAIGARGLYGELDHAENSIIHLSNASHIITKLWWEGNSLMGESEILPTPNGIILKKLIECGCRVGISSRGVGNGQTDGNGILVIGESFKLITFDVVADPSTYSAYQTKIVGKRETYEPTNLKFVDTEKFENVRINHKALVSYFGMSLTEEVRQIKEKLRNQ